MPTLSTKLGDTFYYEDSGVPAQGQSDAYHTIFLVHGFMFHGACFRPMIPYAEAHNLRFVLVNQRDYPGSNPLSPDELRDLGNPDLQANVLEGLGRGLVAFLEAFVQKEGISPVRVDRCKRVGGLTILNWSFGNIYTWSILGNVATYESATLDFLERYLRTVVVFDTPNVTTGIALPESIYLPFTDPTVTFETLPEAFSTWVSTYYPPVTDLRSLTDAELAARTNIFDVSQDPKDRPVWKRMTQAERDSVRDPTITQRSGGVMLGPQMNRDIFLNNYKRALLDTNGVLDSVDMLILWCSQSVSDCVYGAKLLSDSLREAGKGQKRKARMERLDGANHFLHWEDPERMVRLLVEYLQ